MITEKNVMDKAKQTVHCYISGKVQGVCFRMSTAQTANRMGIVGWVRNLPDGRVEVKATAFREILEDFRRWLSSGPELAQVQNIECTSSELEEFQDFRII